MYNNLEIVFKIKTTNGTNLQNNLVGKELTTYKI